MVRKIFFGSEAIEYICQELADGGTYARLILEHLSIENGSAESFLPEKIESPSDFREGLDWSDSLQSREMADNDVVNFISEYLAADVTRYFIVETFEEPDTQLNQRKNLPFFTCGQEVYYFLDHRSSAPSKVKLVMKMRRPHIASIMGLASIPDNVTPLQPREILTIETIKLLAEGTTRLVIEAFDGEGFVIWNRQQN